MTRKAAQLNELIDDTVAIARGKPLKPAADRYPYATPDTEWKDVTTAKDRRKAAEYKRRRADLSTAGT